MPRTSLCRKACASLICLSAIAGAGTASAASVLVTNHSFEAPSLGSSPYSLDSSTPVTGWVTPGLGNVGEYAPTDLTGFDGAQTAWSEGGSLSQDLGVPVLANSRYTVRVAIGDRYGPTAFPGFNVDLLAGGTVIGGVDETFFPGGSPGVGIMSDATFQLLTSGLDPSLIGQNLGIRFSSDGAQTNFDNVRINVAPVPIPGSGILLGLAVVATTAVRKRLLNRSCSKVEPTARLL